MPKILIVAPSWVGDTVMAQPLFARLHKRLPNLTLDVLGPGWVLPLLKRMPEVANVWRSPFGHGELKLRERWQLGRKLAQQHYDQVIVLPNSLKSALVPFFAGIPIRTGFVGEMRKGLLNNARKLDKKALPMMVERFAALAERRDVLPPRPVEYPWLQVTREQQAATLAKFGLDLAPKVAVLCPGAEYGPAKRWPSSHFATLARALAQDGYALWLIGSPKDAPVCREINEGSGGICVDLCGSTDLGEAIDLISAASLVVTNDSGLMHVAAALDRPMVALYGSSSPGFTPPLSARARIARIDIECSPCFERECPLGHMRCLVDLKPEHVLAEIGELKTASDGHAHGAAR